jgi:hypothetical protein
MRVVTRATRSSAASNTSATRAGVQLGADGGRRVGSRYDTDRAYHRRLEARVEGTCERARSHDRGRADDVTRNVEAILLPLMAVPFGARQRCCERSECQRERHRRACQRWHEHNGHLERDGRVAERMATPPRPPTSAGSNGPADDLTAHRVERRRAQGRPAARRDPARVAPTRLGCPARREAPKLRQSQ